VASAIAISTERVFYAGGVIIAHLDLDAFFAAVEELERPELRTVPLVVGGDPSGRGVVATANYHARRFGIHSAMSCAEARRRCPKAVFVRPSKNRYSEYSRAVWDTVRDVIPEVQKTGIDEGYLDLTEPAETFRDARSLAEVVQAAVRAQTSLSCSLGIATCKVVAKIASDRKKPGGVTVVRPGAERTFLAPLDIRKLPGVGPRSEERFRRAGVQTIGALASLSDEQLRSIAGGKVGSGLRDRARGIDPRRLEPPGEAISISHEETFPKDVTDRALLHAEIHDMAERVTERLHKRGTAALTITTKVRYGDFSIRSRSRTLSAHTDEASVLGAVACELLDRALNDRPGALRLVGVGASNLAVERQLALVAVDAEGDAA
jgi:DNA polymerase-4